MWFRAVECRAVITLIKKSLNYYCCFMIQVRNAIIIRGFSALIKNYVGRSLDNYAKVLWLQEKQANSKYKDILDEKFIFQNKLCVKGFSFERRF